MVLKHKNVMEGENIQENQIHTEEACHMIETIHIAAILLEESQAKKTVDNSKGNKGREQFGTREANVIYFQEVSKVLYLQWEAAA